MSVEADRVAIPVEGAITRRVRLPNDRRTPAAARALVRSVLADAGLDALLNEALLLTTELSTNAVVHANTDLDIEVTADPGGLTVTVTDFAPGPVEQLAVGPRNERTDIGEVAERGRGLLLVDHFASRWGTVHQPSGKGVWFRLERPGAAVPAAAPLPEDATPGIGALTALLQTDPERHTDEGIADFGTDLLARLAQLTGASGAVLRLDRGDGRGRHIIARYGRAPRDDAATIRLPLTVPRPYVGELELDASPVGYAQPLARIVAERFSLHLENDRLRRADLRRQTWLTFLAEASELLAQSLDVNLTMALIPQLVVPRLGMWCAVHTTDAWGRLQLAAATHADEAALPALHTTLAEEGPDGVLARLEEASKLGTQVMFGTPTEGFVVPLVARGQRLGTLAVGRHPRHRHDADEVAVLEDVARRAALAIDNARIHDERRTVARTLQASLLPPVLPEVAGVGFAAEYVPAGSEVGGDFYDVVPTGANSWVVVVGDVSGKGVQAATVTGLVRDVIRILVDDGKPMAEILARVNRTLVQRGGGRYCTLALASVDREHDGTLRVSLHLAGHDRAVLVRADGRTAFVGAGGTALGLLETIATPSAAVRLRTGDSLIFYTDGVTERRRGRELFGTARLREAARPLAGYPAKVMAARLRSTTINFSVEEPRDDIAILVLRNDA
ncbi:SpoIIE family protein phosphatase [Krasilnikovia sp. MM14-A1004]|uniref:SpoIIE family protein phosphatase n=1 Tax=Krasilnikovia sp. MM14-A1004 TaxID=3373541 RepID=UPI00399CA8A6